MSKDARKNELKKAWLQQERQQFIDSIPLPIKDLRDLFAFLERKGAAPCDHTLRDTIGFLLNRGIEVDPVVLWLQKNGGYCDCEVVLNVADKF